MLTPERLRFPVSAALLIIMPAMAGAQTTRDIEGLRQLRCISLQVLTGESPAIAPSREELRQILLVAIRSKLPRLAVADHCADRLSLWSHVKDISERPRFNGFYAHLQLSLYRRAQLLETHASITPEVWTSAVSYFHGPPKTAREQATSLIEQSVTEFAAAYYEAGNE